jgi:hypothetical protein
VAAAPAVRLALALPAMETAGAPFMVTVTALDAFGNTATGFADTIHFSSTDPAASLPADYTFVAADQGRHTFAVTLRKTSAPTLTVNDQAGVVASARTMTMVVAAGATSLTAQAPPATIGSPVPLTVTARDAFGNLATSYTGTVHFSSTDPRASLPGDYTFSASDQGVHAFLVTFGTLGIEGITAADPANSFFTANARVSVSATGGPPGVVSYRATGADAGGGPEVKVYDAASGTLKLDFMAYDPHFLGGVRVAVGDVTGDGVPDVFTAPGPGGGPDIRVFDGVTGTLVREFLAYSAYFLGGVYVATGDVTGDGVADIVTGADAGGGPQVNVYSGRNGSLVRAFMAYIPFFTGGVRVAVGDVEGTGQADIIAGPGAGGGPDVRLFSGATGALLREWLAFGPFFQGGVYVAAGDVNGDGKADIITGAGPSGSPNIVVFSGTDGSVLENFLAFGPFFTGGVRVGFAAGAGILAGAGPSGGPELAAFGTGAALLDAVFAYDPAFSGGIFVGGQ